MNKFLLSVYFFFLFISTLCADFSVPPHNTAKKTIKYVDWDELIYDDFIDLIQYIEYTDKNTLKEIFQPKDLEVINDLYIHLAQQGASYIDVSSPQLKKNSKDLTSGDEEILSFIKKYKKEIVIGASIKTVEYFCNYNLNVPSTLERIPRTSILLPCTRPKLFPTYTQSLLQKLKKKISIRQLFFYSQ